MANNPTLLLVVAANLRRHDGLWLMHKRPIGKQHGGLWEFPGGKVEVGETPVNALIRELSEELSISVRTGDCHPIAFAETTHGVPSRPIVILLYTIDHWTGDPKTVEGGAIEWFAPCDVALLDMPPLDHELLAQLRPEHPLR